MTPYVVKHHTNNKLSECGVGVTRISGTEMDGQQERQGTDAGVEEEDVWRWGGERRQQGKS